MESCRCDQTRTVNRFTSSLSLPSYLWAQTEQHSRVCGSTAVHRAATQRNSLFLQHSTLKLHFHQKMMPTNHRISDTSHIKCWDYNHTSVRPTSHNYISNCFSKALVSQLLLVATATLQCRNKTKEGIWIWISGATLDAWIYTFKHVWPKIIQWNMTIVTQKLQKNDFKGQGGTSAWLPGAKVLLQRSQRRHGRCQFFPRDDTFSATHTPHKSCSFPL